MTSGPRHRALLPLLPALLLCWGCGSSPHASETPPSPDATAYHDAGRPDVGPDAGADGGVDAGCPNPCGTDRCCSADEVCGDDGECCAPDCAGRRCGSNGCGGTCGHCAEGEACNAAGLCECVPESDDDFCQRIGANCGEPSAPDNCGTARSVQCGRCTEAQECDPTTHRCGPCIAEPSQTLCANNHVECGPLDAQDHCGNARHISECGGCGYSELCDATGICQICTPETDAELCAGMFFNCGSAPFIDRCGIGRTVMSCGSCTSPYTCQPTNACGLLGVPTNDTCASPQRLLFDAQGHATTTGDTLAALHDANASCEIALGSDLVYGFVTTAPKNVTVRVVPAGQSFRPVVSVRSSCAQENTEMPGSCAEASAGGATASTTLRRLPAGTWFIWVDAPTRISGAFTLTVDAVDPPPAPANDTCAGATPLSFTGTTATLVGDTTDASDDFKGTCGALYGGDLVYRFSLSTESAVLATLTRGALATDYLPALYLRSRCESALPADEAGCGSATSVVADVNLPHLAAGTWYLIVDGSSNSVGPFTLQVVAQPAAPNDTCGSPTPILIDASTGLGSLTDDTRFAANDAATSCLPTGSGRDLVYSFDVPAGSDKDVEIQVIPNGATATLDPAVSVRTRCDLLASEVACRVNSGAGSALALPLTRLPAGAYYVWVDGARAGADGPFTLQVALTDPQPPPPNDTCAGAISLPLDPRAGDASTPGTTAAAGNDLAGGCSPSASGHTGGDVVYQVQLAGPSGFSARVRRNPGTPDYLPAVYLRSTCGDPASELLCSSAASPDTSFAVVAAPNLPSGTYYVVVDGLAGTVGDFTLDLARFDPLTHDDCLTPKALVFDSAGAAHARVDTCAATPSTAGSCGGSGRDVVYAFTLGSASDVTAVLTPRHGGSSALHLRTTCGALATEMSCRVNTTGGPVRLPLRNLSAGTYYLWVDESSPSCGLVDLEVTAVTPAPFAANDVCNGAAPIAIDSVSGIGTAQGDTLNARNDYDGSCRAGSGPDLVYSVTLDQPAGVTVTLTPTPGTSYNPALYLRTSCEAAGTELACSNLVTGATLTATLPRLQAGTYYIIADSYGAQTVGSFDLEVRRVPAQPAPTHDVCAGATPIPIDPMTHTGTVSGDTRGATDDFSSYCATTAAPLNGPDLVYSFTLNTPASVTARVTANNGFYKPAVSIRTQCGDATSEAACARDVIGVSTATASLPAGTYYVLVDGVGSTLNGSAYGPFLLTLTTGGFLDTDDCGSPGTLTFDSAGLATAAGDLTGLNDSTTGSCVGSGADAVYELVLASDSSVQVTVTDTELSALFPSLSLRRTCNDPATEVGCNYSQGRGQASLQVNRLLAGTYFVWVDGGTPTHTGGFTLSVQTSPPGGPAPANDLCAAAEVLQLDPQSLGAHAVGDTTWASNDYAGSCATSSAPHSGGDVAYAFTLNRAATVYAIVNRDPATPNLAVALYLRTVCGSGAPADELACAAVSTGGTAGASASIVKPLPPGTYYLIVDGQKGSFGRFTLDVVARTAPAPVNDICTAAEAIALDSNGRAMVAGDTSNATNSAASGHCNNGVSGSDVVYSVTLDATKDLFLDLQPGGTLQPMLYVNTPCDSAATQVGCAARQAVGTPLRLALSKLPAGTYYLWVDSAAAGASSAGPFVLTVQASDPPPLASNDTCAAPQDITFDSTGRAVVFGDTNTGLDDATASCATAKPFNGPDLVYSFTLPDAASLTATATATGPASAFVPALYLRATCTSGASTDEGGCVAGTGGIASLTTSLPAGVYYLIVDGVASTFGPFALELTTGAPTVGDSCLLAQPLYFDRGDVAQISGSTSRLGNHGDGSCQMGSRGDMIFSFDARTEKALTVTVAPSTGSPLRPMVYVRSACAGGDLANERVCAYAGPANTPVTANIQRLPRGTYYLYVDGTPLGGNGDFTGSVTLFDPFPAPANDVCAGATPLTFASNSATASVDTTWANNDTTGTCGIGNGPDLIYTFATSATQKVSIKFTRSSATPNFQPLIYLRSDCNSALDTAELTCLAIPGVGYGTAVVNALPAGQYWIFVDGQQPNSAASPGLGTLEVTLAAAALGGPTNDSCPSAQDVPIVGGTGSRVQITGTTAGASPEASGTCASTSVWAPDVVYKVTLSTEQKLTATVTASNSPSYMPLVYIRTACASMLRSREIDCAQGSAGGSATATASDAEPGTYWIWVDSPSSAPLFYSGAFTLDIALDAPVVPPANDRCAGATTLTYGTVVTGDTTGAHRDYVDGPPSAACLAMFYTTPIGPDVVYTYVPARDGIFTVTVTPTSAFDPTLWYTDGTCGSQADCEGISENGLAGIIETLTIYGLTGRTYYFYVGSPTWATASSRAGSFTIAVN